MFKSSSNTISGDGTANNIYVLEEGKTIKSEKIIRPDM